MNNWNFNQQQQKNPQQNFQQQQNNFQPMNFNYMNNMMMYQQQQQIPQQKLNFTMENPIQNNKLENKPQKVNLRLTPNERGYYSSLHSQMAENVESNKVLAKDAVGFFKKSGVSVEVLKSIWILASSNNDYLDRDEFYKALKLISFAQNNIEVSINSLVENIPSPLPKFSQISNNKGEKSSSDNNEDIYIITREKFCSYEKYFLNSQNNNEGIVNYNEARGIYMKSGLSDDIIEKIWNLIDINKLGNLNKGEFIAGLHLLMIARKGNSIPNYLPKVLDVFIRENDSRISLGFFLISFINRRINFFFFCFYNFFFFYKGNFGQGKNESKCI